ncbi:MAG: PEP-CTERM sorting domain-containing protein, partial [Mangrovicoccus sp.]
TRDSGAAYVFDLETGAQKFKLTSDEALGYDNFGVSVALAGNTALVGANEVWDGADGYSAGAVFLFDTTTGEQTGVLRQNDIDPYDRFGSDIVTYGNYALIGTSGHDIAGQFAGAAYLFDIETQTQLVKITPDDAEENSYFGNSLALSDRYAVIGAQRADLGGHDRGAAYIFDFLTGEQIKLTAPDGEDQDFFGSSVAIFGDVVLVGARYDSHFSPSSVGSVYAFDVMGNVLGKLYPSAAISGDSYGAKILFDLDAILIGAPGDRTNGSKSGAVYAYTRAADAAPQALSSAAPLNASSLLSLFTPIPSPAAVPLPASLWLLGAGVLGLSIRTRGLRAR